MSARPHPLKQCGYANDPERVVPTTVRCGRHRRRAKSRCTPLGVLLCLAALARLTPPPRPRRRPTYAVADFVMAALRADAEVDFAALCDLLETDDWALSKAMSVLGAAGAR